MDLKTRISRRRHAVVVSGVQLQHPSSKHHHTCTSSSSLNRWCKLVLEGCRRRLTGQHFPNVLFSGFDRPQFKQRQASAKRLCLPLRSTCDAARLSRRCLLDHVLSWFHVKGLLLSLVLQPPTNWRPTSPYRCCCISTCFTFPAGGYPLPSCWRLRSVCV